jgi:prolyl-tRNA synthetase
MVGGVIMTHGDDAGLRLPPKVAPIQVIIVIVKDDPAVTAEAETLAHDLRATGLRVRIDDRTDLGLGRRLTDWELKGIPVRIEIGPRDLSAGTVKITRRDGTNRESVAIDAAAAAAADAVQSVHDALFAQASEALSSRTADTDDLESAMEAARVGFARVPWAVCGREGEQEVNRAGLSVRCLTHADGSIPSTTDGDDGLYAILARAY